ncbi:MAG: hypothetical protein M1818_008416 [Claussenomyces sp. TS43310]|nr:MAG: hypothetical protein M1818_008416 [Claussenomyces sp. TS43310]
MASTTPSLRYLSCWKHLLRRTRRQNAAMRALSTHQHPRPAAAYPVSQIPTSLPTPATTPHVTKNIKIFPPPPSPAALFKDPVSSVQQGQISTLDPSGARTELFSRDNRDCARVGDILLVRQKNGDPFAGVCINIRRRGVDSAILLRNELTKVGVEMWYKIYSPNVEGIEVVQRKEKRARRARLTYMRKPKHDMRSVEGIVQQYQRQRAVTGAGGKSDRRFAGKRGKGKK